MKFSIKNRIQSFKHAIQGCNALIKNEHNFRVHIFAALVAMCLSIVFQVSSIEFIFVLGAVFLVFILEAINTSIEYLCNYLTIERDESIKKIKDVSAFAVLLSAIYAFVVGLVIFVPKILQILIK